MTERTVPPGQSFMTTPDVCPLCKQRPAVAGCEGACDQCYQPTDRGNWTNVMAEATVNGVVDRLSKALHLQPLDALLAVQHAVNVRFFSLGAECVAGDGWHGLGGEGRERPSKRPSNVDQLRGLAGKGDNGAKVALEVLSRPPYVPMMVRCGVHNKDFDAVIGCVECSIDAESKP